MRLRLLHFFVFVAVFSLPPQLLGCFRPGPCTYIGTRYDRAEIRKVAVFPFYNNTEVSEASRIVTGAFIANLVEQGKFKVEFPGSVRRFLVSERIIVRTGIDLDTINLMGKRLGVDAVVLGRVEEYVGSSEEKKNVIPLVSISSRLVDIRTGEILFMAQHRRTGEDYRLFLDFGEIRSAGALAKRVVAEIIDEMP